MSSVSCRKCCRRDQWRFKGASDGGCKGSSLGSQVYGRAVWHNGLWVIMYAWYFPKDKPSFPSKNSGKGTRHNWMNVAVWLNNPSLETPTMIGVSPSTYRYVTIYSKYTSSPEKPLDTPAMISYQSDDRGFHVVDMTSKTGGNFQDLIMWEPLTDEARQALSETDFGRHVPVPFIDANFLANLDKTWPYR